jgi:hypothetical protein
MPRERLTEYLASLLWDGFSGQTAAAGGDDAASPG